MFNIIRVHNRFEAGVIELQAAKIYNRRRVYAGKRGG